MTETPVTDMSFEEAMSALESVLERLERGDVALDESIALYERGAALKAAPLAASTATSIPRNV